MSHKIEDGDKRVTRARTSRIKWRACGPDLRDRAGHVEGREALQITYCYGAPGYRLCFHHEERAQAGTLDEAKARAERDLKLWDEERRLRREQEAAAAARRLRDRRAHDERIAELVARLNAEGIAARELFGAITLTDEATEQLLGRIAIAGQHASTLTSAAACRSRSGLRLLLSEQCEVLDDVDDVLLGAGVGGEAVAGLAHWGGEQRLDHGVEALLGLVDDDRGEQA